MSGYVYFIQAGKDGPVKIGWAKDPIKRMKELQCASAATLRLLAAERGGRDLEAAFHRVFAVVRIGGEWFAPSSLVLAHCGAACFDYPMHDFCPELGGRPDWKAEVPSKRDLADELCAPRGRGPQEDSSWIFSVMPEPV